MEKIISVLKKIIPSRMFGMIRPVYHYKMALLGALIYRFPSRKIKVVGITGTKGKTSTAEITNAILEEAGFKTALASTLRIKIGENSKPNLFKMTMPGRFFLQKFLRQAVNAKCDYAVVEMTSQGAVQFRHKFINLNALIFTNISPEHIESHGSFEKYLEAKLKLAKSLEKSPKKNKAVISNLDDKFGNKFLDVNVPIKSGFIIKDAEPYALKNDGIEMTFEGQKIQSELQGLFNVYNILASAKFARTQNIQPEIIAKGIGNVGVIKGRMEKIKAGQDFTVVVDYAHTADSLEKAYGVYQNFRKIGVLGNTGGGRDKWKRPAMGTIADRMCDEIILTNEDPYDENPRAIVDEMAVAFKKHIPEIIMDRREAISTAIRKAKPGDVVIITGKGTDPYIMEANGAKIPWSDAKVAEEELKKMLAERKN